MTAPTRMMTTTPVTMGAASKATDRLVGFTRTAATEVRTVPGTSLCRPLSFQTRFPAVFPVVAGGPLATLARMSDVTRILDRVQRGEPKAADELLPLVYEELRKLAAARMTTEVENHTLQPTALVHEAWLRLTGDEAPAFENRAHFFGAAAEAMRRILIERARKRNRERHGAELQRVNFEQLDVANPEDDTTLLAVTEALNRLAMHDPEGAELIKLRFFAGMPNVEAARVLGLSERTAKRTWAYARAWLYEELRRSL